MLLVRNIRKGKGVTRKLGGEKGSKKEKSELKKSTKVDCKDSAKKENQKRGKSENLSCGVRKKETGNLGKKGTSRRKAQAKESRDPLRCKKEKITGGKVPRQGIRKGREIEKGKNR